MKPNFALLFFLIVTHMGACNPSIKPICTPTGNDCSADGIACCANAKTQKASHCSQEVCVEDWCLALGSTCPRPDGVPCCLYRVDPTSNANSGQKVTVETACVKNICSVVQMN